MSSLAFRLRIRNAADTDPDDLVVTSVRSGTNPYIAEVPSGDGQEVDLLTGAVRSGSYVVAVADVVTGSDLTGVTRLVTSKLADTAGRQQLLSRRAYVEASTDNFATTPAVWMAGYVTNVRQVSAITYAITVSDSRRVEQNHKAFTWGDNPQDSAKSERVLFPNRGCVLGGPIVGGFGPTLDSGGILTSFKLEETAAQLGDYSGSGTRVAALRFVASADIPPFFNVTYSFQEYATYANRILAPYARSSTPYTGLTDAIFDPLKIGAIGGANSFPELSLYATTLDGATTWVGDLRGFLPQTTWSPSNNGYIPGLESGAYLPYIYVTWKANQPAAPATDTALFVRVIPKLVTERAPIYIDMHPVDIATKLYDSVNIPYKATGTNSAAAIKDALGPNLRLAARITQPVPMATFLSESLYGPFGFSARVNASGEQEFFRTRRFVYTTPATTITTNDLQGDDVPAVFDLDESTVCTALRFEWSTLARAVTTPESNTPPPPDGITEVKNILEIASADTTTYSTREVSYRLPGMIHDDNTWEDAMSQVIGGTAVELFDRYGRGAPTYELAVLTSSLNIGDEVLIDVAHAPNTNYRIGESTVGPRVAQVVRRDETPTGPRLKLVDLGPAQQITTAPTFTLAKESVSPRAVASFTVTNAATLNAIPAGLEVEYTAGSATPTTAGTPFIAYAPGQIPTAKIVLPAFVFGSKVWVRMRTTRSEYRPSAWTAWTSVQLDAWTAPSAISVGSITSVSAAVTWTNGSALDPVDLYVAPGTTAPSDWTPYRWTTLMAGSDRTVLNNLTASTQYVVGVAHRDPGTGQSTAVASAAFTTGSPTATAAPTLTAVAVIETTPDAQFPSGIPLAFWAADDALQIEVQRAPDSSGSPGTWATIAVVPGATAVFLDPLPQTNATYWYRARHSGGSFSPSAYTTPISSTVRSLPPNLVRPPRVTPSLNLVVDITDTTYELTWDSIGTVEVWLGGAAISPQPTSPFTIARPDDGTTVGPYTIYATSPTFAPITESVTVLSRPPRIDSFTIEKINGTDAEAVWTTNWVPSGATFYLTGTITVDGSGTDSVSNATSPETLVFTSLGSAPEGLFTLQMISSNKQVLATSVYDGALLLGPPPPPPTLVGVAKLLEVQSIDCGQPWEIQIAWTTTSPDDTNFEIQIFDFDTLATVASGLTTSSSTYTHDTGETGSAGGSGYQYTRRYTVKLVQTIGGAVIGSADTNRITSSIVGAPC